MQKKCVRSFSEKEGESWGQTVERLLWSRSRESRDGELHPTFCLQCTYIKIEVQIRVEVEVVSKSSAILRSGQTVRRNPGVCFDLIIISVSGH